MIQDNKKYYVAKGITVKMGYSNAAIYDLPRKKVFLISIDNAKNLLRTNSLSSPELLQKLMDLGLITADASACNQSPLIFDYSLFQDAYDYQHCSLIYLDVSNICNFRCVHCYAEMETESETPFLSYENAKTLLAKISIAGKCNIRITGGEPFLNPDIDAIIDLVPQVIEPMRRHSIATNGSFSFEQAIKAIRLKYELQVSIYGMTEKTFQLFTKKPPTIFNDLMSKLIRIAEAGYANDVVLSMSVTELNYCEIDAFLEFATQYGFRKVLNRPASAGRAAEKWNIIQLSEDHQLQFAKITSKEIPFFCYHLCQLFWASVGITGDLTPCPYFRTQEMCMGNLYQQDFATVWNNQKYEAFRKLTATDVEFCKDCEFVYLCTAGCCGETFSYYGDLKKCYPWCGIKPYQGAKYVDLNNDEVAIVKKYAAGIFDFKKI